MFVDNQTRQFFDALDIYLDARDMVRVAKDKAGGGLAAARAAARDARLLLVEHYLAARAQTLRVAAGGPDRGRPL